MKKHLVIFVCLALLFSLFVQSARAQDDNSCDPAALKDWLIQRQSWRNATTDVLSAVESSDELTYNDVYLYLHEHLQHIADLDRPACADTAMLWTYFAYDAVQNVFICSSLNRMDCVTSMETRMEAYGAAIEPIIVNLEQIAGLTSADYMDTRPDGWTMEATYSIETVDTDDLTLTGDRDKVFDEFIFVGARF